MKIINMEKNELTEKEQYFCCHYINTGNIREAAALAGYKNEPERRGVKLLSNQRVKKEIERLYLEKRKSLMYKACIGYERLAFGSIADAIRLLYSDSLDTGKLEDMDLFNISEIKRPKEGAMEIKFFDRLRALEKLEEADSGYKDSLGPFYRALEQGIKALNSCDSENIQGE